MLRPVSLVLLLTTFCVISCKKSDSSKANALTGDLPQSIYRLMVDNDTNKAEILVAPFTFTAADSGHLMIFNQHGTLQWEKYLPGTATDFKKWVVGGKTRYSYFTNDVNAYQLGIVGGYVGYVTLMDENLQELKRVNLLPYNDITTDQAQNLDAHDFIYLGDNHFITMAYYIKSTQYVPSYYNPSKSGHIVVPIIQEVNNGAVTFQWDPSTDTTFYGQSIIDHNYNDDSIPQDYLHLNSMFIDPKDDNLILSFRSAEQIVKINRKTGATMWRLGGKNSDYYLLPNQTFLYQHCATLTDSNQTLMMFDNGDAVARPRSRILEFRLDEVNRQVIGFKSLDILEEAFSNIMGSVQKMGQNYFIGGGSGNFVLEVNALNDTKLFEMRSEPYSSYRAFKYTD